ncbi:MAG TPA: DUF3344 domain-containing protein [Polyangiaceae bacterium]|nr:DUF3344 domain-containing protein [Polyangiaceae bacterium]
MRTAAEFLALASAGAIALGTSVAVAAPALRIQVNQQGDMAWIGNTSAQECAGTARAPVVGTVGNCGANVGDSAADLFWRSDDVVAGDATAELTHTAATARSTAVLTLPAGSTVTYARLYWGAELAADMPDRVVTIERPGGFNSDVTADTSYSVMKLNFPGVFWYESTVDVTDIVKAQGEGAYRVSGIDSVDVNNFQSDDTFVAWSLVVFYELTSEPQRNLALFDGMDFVNAGNPATAMLSGFLVPNAGFDAKLGVMAYEGDVVFLDDALIFNGNALSDAVNPANNFFNGSRSWLGVPVSNSGDLPQMDGMAASMSGVDLDIVDVTPFVAAGDVSATIQATSAGDTYVIGAFATSISTLQPAFKNTLKSFSDVNGGSVVRGDLIEYSIDVVNSGNDTAVGVVLTDTLPAGISYVPGTIEVANGTNMGAKTDALGDDQGEYDAATRTVTVRLGAGADATLGGSLAIGETITVKFQAKIEPEAVGDIANQAIITAAGLAGNPVTNYPSGNGNPDTPTTFTIVECDSNTDCSAPKGVCDTASQPHACVQCLTDADCGAADSGRVCEAKMCIDGCRGTGGNVCPAGEACSSNSNASGTCQNAPASLPTGSIQGGGCDCTVLQPRSAAPPALTWLCAALVTAGVSRRRWKRRAEDRAT